MWVAGCLSLFNYFLVKERKSLDCVVHTNLLWISQVEEVQVALVSHLLVCGEHDDVAAEIKATRSDSRVGVEQGQLFTCTAQRHKAWFVINTFLLLKLCIEKSCHQT